MKDFHGADVEYNMDVPVLNNEIPDLYARPSCHLAPQTH
jgi:hypothetical protein